MVSGLECIHGATCSRARQRPQWLRGLFVFRSELTRFRLSAADKQRRSSVATNHYQKIFEWNVEQIYWLIWWSLSLSLITKRKAEKQNVPCPPVRLIQIDSPSRPTIVTLIRYGLCAEVHVLCCCCVLRELRPPAGDRLSSINFMYTRTYLPSAAPVCVCVGVNSHVTLNAYTFRDTKQSARAMNSRCNGNFLSSLFTRAPLGDLTKCTICSAFHRQLEMKKSCWAAQERGNGVEIEVLNRRRSCPIMLVQQQKKTTNYGIASAQSVVHARSFLHTGDVLRTRGSRSHQFQSIERNDVKRVWFVKWRSAGNKSLGDRAIGPRRTAEQYRNASLYINRYFRFSAAGLCGKLIIALHWDVPYGLVADGMLVYVMRMNEWSEWLHTARHIQ